MKQEEQDKLQAIFAQIKSDSPSMSFENNLMQRIRDAHKLAERKRKRLALLSMVAGALSMILLPTIVLYLLGWNIVDVIRNSDVTLDSTFQSINIDSMMLSISVVCLLLLMIDLLVRRHIRKKESEK